MLAFVCFYSLYSVIGGIMWISFAILMASLFVCYYMLTWVNKFNEERKKDDEKRSSILSEIIEHIRVIKMNSWITCFSDIINKMRQKHYKNEVIIRFLYIPQHLAHHISYWTMVISTFFVCVFVFNMKISAPAAILIWRCVGKIKDHSGHIPHFTNFLSEFVTSVKRIENFLLCDEIEEKMTEKLDCNDSEVAIEFKKSNFFWGFDLNQNDGEKEEQKNEEKPSNNSEPMKNSILTSNSESTSLGDDNNTQTLENRIALRGVDLKIKRGEFVAIIGDVGAGKSSLIYSLLGETLYVDDQILEKYGEKELDYTKDKNDGDEIPPAIKEIMDARKQNVNGSEAKIRIAGSVSLVEQKPFIISKTIRENILFGEELDENRYNKTIEICQLTRDLEILEGGDLTHIGEKGINLSGGQKARLSVARAVYSNKDIILMDDPLSALDAHVKKSIFDEVCCKELKDRTRVLVTHAVDFLDSVDRIIVVDKGKIKLNGTYSELMEHNYFQKIMNTIHKIDKKNEDENSSAADDSDGQKEKRTKNHTEVKEKKLLEQEDEEEVDASFNTYLQYFAFCKSGLGAIFVSIILMFAMRYLQMKNDYLILNWVRDFTATGNAEYGTLLFLISLVAASLILEI